MSTAYKKTLKSKFLSDDIEDFNTDAKVMKENKPKRTQKRQSHPEENHLSPNQRPSNSKTLKGMDYETGKLVSGKIISVMDTQICNRKKDTEQMLDNISDIIGEMKADSMSLKNNQQKLQHLVGAIMKNMDQAISSQDEKIKSLNDFYMTQKKKLEEEESKHKAEINKLASEVDADIEKLQQKLITETKRSGWEILRKSFFHTMENDF